jgi:F-type H+-transporting ATPase subunit epsilon
MADTFQLEIVTPDKLLVKDTADEVQIPGKAGYMDVLRGHAPLITELTIGEITYRWENQPPGARIRRCPDKVTIPAQLLTSSAPLAVGRRRGGWRLRAEADLLTTR